MCGGGIEFGVCKATREEKTQKVTGHVRGIHRDNRNKVRTNHWYQTHIKKRKENGKTKMERIIRIIKVRKKEQSKEVAKLYLRKYCWPFDSQ